MSSSRWPAIVAALLAALAADSNLTGKVYDGIPVTADDIRDGVFIGVVLDEDNGDAGTFEQDWHELGGLPPRDESGSVRCTVVCQRGDTDLASARGSAFTHLGWVESVVRNNLDLDVADITWVQVKAGSVRQGQTPRGSFCEIEFSVSYTAVI